MNPGGRVKKSVLAFALALTSASARASSYHAPLAPELLDARRVCIKVVDPGANTDVLNDTFTYFHKWERFAVVQSPWEADIVVEIGAHYTGTELNQYWARGQVLEYDLIVVRDSAGRSLWWARVVPGIGQTKVVWNNLRKEIIWHEKHGNAE
jgi:hypothetical protein